VDEAALTNLPYLHQLTLRLVEGIERLPEETRRRHADWLVSRQNADGGFSGREGGSDLYYTGFALRSLAVLQSLSPELCGKAGAYLRSRMTDAASVIDLFSWLVSGFLARLGGGPDLFHDAPADWPDRVAGLLERFRAADGGYAKHEGAISGSTYHSFLVMLALQLLDREAPRLDEMARFVRSRRRDDGGYVEIAPMKRSGTNPTAAGVGILQIAGALDDDAKSAVADFLVELPSEFEGGLRANGRIPAADLLSTFTGSWTMAQIGALDRLDATAIREYAESCEVPTGGFRGGLWDEGVDVEYTFYGLGALALFAE
jgi:geranylgeranyl transferase type-2 subunit beta